MYVDDMVDAFQDEIRKIANAASVGATAGKKAYGASKYLVPAALGIGAWETARTLNKDRKLGRQMRLQQGGGY